MIRLKARAKVNYALEVRGTRPDGYHEISTIMQSISLSDTLEMRRAESGFHLSVEPEDADAGPLEQNSVRKAWAALRELTGRELPSEARLSKRIPAGAGLGGASADAAAALTGLNELFDLGMDENALCEAGVRVGADVPFCIVGGTALAEGVGERLAPLPEPPDHGLLIAKPRRWASTAEVYRLHDELSPAGSASVKRVASALHGEDLDTFASSLGNDLAGVTRGLVLEVGELERALLEAGALGAVMSGSGTAVCGIFRSKEDARKAGQELCAPFVEVCEPVRRGVEML